MNGFPLTAELSRYVSETGWPDLPDPVRHEAKRALLNFFGTAISGSRQPAIDIALASMLELTHSSEATVIGRKERCDLLTASFLNAASANIADFDDTHIPTIIHPTAPVAPGLLAISERRRLDGETFLTAFVLGVEIACRIGLALSPDHYRKGWHITATCGVLGAAVASAKALGLSPEAMTWALGNAATQSAGLVECLGTMAKSLGVGNASRHGLWSALLAQRGFDAPATTLEGEQGFFAVMGAGSDLAEIVEGLGTRWEILNNTYKPYACGVVINPVIDACLALRTQLASSGSAPTESAISRVTVRGAPLLLARADRPDIQTGREAQVSAQHLAAVALLHGADGLQPVADSTVADRQIQALRRRIDLVADEAVGLQSCFVTLQHKDGRTLTASVSQARGSLENPLTDREVTEKFERLTDETISRAQRGALVDGIWSLEEQPAVSRFLPLTIPR